MCGIAGLWQRRSRPADDLRAIAEAMRDALAYRGPDDAGHWQEGDVALEHRRLSIIDLSAEGHQPMASADGRFVMVYNGEVFNFLGLRDELAKLGHRFRGGSDTEVLLAAFVQWGVRPAVQRFVGMFAFALWDRQERVLHLVRDRLGIKPLFVGRTADGDLVFGSELKALVAHPAFERRVDPAALGQFLRYKYVPSPGCIYRDAAKVPPGHILTLRSPDTPWTASEAFWSAEAVAEQGRRNPFAGDDREAVAALDELLGDAVEMRLISDVPLGAFLSGGIDSSLICALMQRRSTAPVRTFTIGFTESAFDESAYARDVARRLGTVHTEVVVRPADAQAVIPGLAATYDEPFADVSQIPTCLVSALARKEVTVALTGEGGDELFAGYARYGFVDRTWRVLDRVPVPVRRWSARALRTVPRGLYAWAGPGKLSQDRVDKLADVLECRSPGEVFDRLVSNGGEASAMQRTRVEPDGGLSRLLAAPSPLDWNDRMLLADLKVNLPDDLLTKLDRASMAVSLEGRVPLLDHRVVEFSWTLPPRFKNRNGVTKWLLKELLARYLPRESFEREKQGFEVPVGAWLRQGLRPWAEQLLAEERVRAGGLLDAAVTARLWREHLSGRRNAGHLLWSVLMLESWRERWGASL
jgi:asparagine synthase (glutamine-hydrolysing)